MVGRCSGRSGGAFRTCFPIAERPAVCGLRWLPALSVLLHCAAHFGRSGRGRCENERGEGTCCNDIPHDCSPWRLLDDMNRQLGRSGDRSPSFGVEASSGGTFSRVGESTKRGWASFLGTRYHDSVLGRPEPIPPGTHCRDGKRRRCREEVRERSGRAS